MSMSGSDQREDQKKANQRVAVHYSLWEQAKVTLLQLLSGISE